MSAIHDQQSTLIMNSDSSVAPKAIYLGGEVVAGDPS